MTKCYQCRYNGTHFIVYKEQIGHFGKRLINREFASLVKYDSNFMLKSIIIKLVANLLERERERESVTGYQNILVPPKHTSLIQRR